MRRKRKLHAALPVQGESPTAWARKTRCLVTVPLSLITVSLKTVTCDECHAALEREERQRKRNGVCLTPW